MRCSARPPPLRLFLLTVAIVDDIGAVAIIALVYTATIDPAWLGAAALALAAMAVLNRLGARQGWVYGLLALATWYAVLHSGIHATVAGVLGFAGRPRGTSWAQMWGMATLCGIGFTMSLFIAALAFPARPELVEQAKLGILGGSLVSAVAG